MTTLHLTDQGWEPVDTPAPACTYDSTTEPAEPAEPAHEQDIAKSITLGGFIDKCSNSEQMRNAKDKVILDAMDSSQASQTSASGQTGPDRH